MFFQGELTPNGYSFFPVRYDVVLPEALLERVSVLTVEQSHPLGLFTQVFEDRIVSLRQHPDGLLGVAAGEGQLREGVFLFRHRLRGAAVVDDEKGRLALETMVPKAEPIVQAFARVDSPLKRWYQKRSQSCRRSPGSTIYISGSPHIHGRP